MADRRDCDDYEWKPPTEAEQKVIEARKERSDKIAKLMGDYLLRGYKMLATECGDCGNILFRDTNGQDYCIACNDLDSDGDKDNPATNHQAALSQVRECQLSATHERECHLADPRRNKAQNMLKHLPALTNSMQQASATSLETSNSVQSLPKPLEGGVTIDSDYGMETLSCKLSWAFDELRKTSSVDYGIQLCQFIKEATEAYQNLKSLQTCGST